MKFLECVPLLMLGAILFVTPNMTRRGLLFAVPVPEDFRASGTGRHAIALFRMIVALAAIGGVAVELVFPANFYVSLAPLLLTAIAVVAYYRANRMVAPFRAVQGGERSVEMSVAPERMPRMLWLSIGPLLILGVAAVFLYRHWVGIPATFPVHWGLDGTPDRWAQKNAKSVFGTIFFGAEFCVWLAGCSLVSWYGARRSSLRSSIVELMIAVDYFMAILFSFLALLPVIQLPAWLTIVLVLAPVPVLIGFIMKKAGEPSDPAENTPAECWKGSVVYYNPNDPALVVEKRVGFGYTLNFGNRWSWVFAAGLALIVASVPVILM